MARRGWVRLGEARQAWRGLAGLGAKRSQGMGQLDVLAWDRLNGVH